MEIYLIKVRKRRNSFELIRFMKFMLWFMIWFLNFNFSFKNMGLKIGFGIFYVCER